MKRLVIVLALIIMASSCGKDEKKENETTVAPTQTYTNNAYQYECLEYRYKCGYQWYGNNYTYYCSNVCIRTTYGYTGY